ncbi:MAG: hypothetical protein QXL51_00565 [Candidatus Aenigmatarchaeota archaeon]
MKKLSPNDIYFLIANYLIKKYKEDSLKEKRELMFLLKKFDLKRKEDFVKSYNILYKIYKKEFIKFFYNDEKVIIRIRLTSSLYLEIEKNSFKVKLRKIK